MEPGTAAAGCSLLYYWTCVYSLSRYYYRKASSSWCSAIFLWLCVDCRTSLSGRHTAAKQRSAELKSGTEFPHYSIQERREGTKSSCRNLAACKKQGCFGGRVGCWLPMAGGVVRSGRIGATRLRPGGIVVVHLLLPSPVVVYRRQHPMVR